MFYFDGYSKPKFEQLWGTVCNRLLLCTVCSAALCTSSSAKAIREEKGETLGAGGVNHLSHHGHGVRVSHCVADVRVNPVVVLRTVWLWKNA